MIGPSMDRGITRTCMTGLVMMLVIGASRGFASGEQPLVIFEMTGTVDIIAGTPPFSVRKGDSLRGTFSFHPDSADSYSSTSQGHYLQEPPAAVEFTLGDIVFHSDPKTFPEYYVDIENDDASVEPVRDIFRWVASDPILAASFGVEEIQANMILQNLNAEAFTDDSLPSQLKTHDFVGQLFLIASSQIGPREKTSFWHLGVRVNSIQRK